MQRYKLFGLHLHKGAGIAALACAMHELGFIYHSSTLCTDKSLSFTDVLKLKAVLLAARA